MIVELITEKMVYGLLPDRAEESSKRDYGSVLAVAGSEGMMGAGVLCAEAALRGGAGLVTLCCPRELFVIPQTAIPEAMCIDRKKDILTAEKLNSYTAIAFGPGLGRSAEVTELLAHIFENYSGTLVLDADGLNVLAASVTEGHPAGIGEGHKCRLILTPHAAEASRLLGCSYEKVASDRNGAALELARRYGAAVAVKGHHTAVCLENGRAFANSTGNPGMATGGSGDVLCGLVAALSAQFACFGINPSYAAIAGVWLHGKAGDAAAKEFGQYSLLAGDITNYFPLAFPPDT